MGGGEEAGGGNRITRGNGLERPAGEDDGGEGEATVSLTCGTGMEVGPDVSGLEEGHGRGLTLGPVAYGGPMGLHVTATGLDSRGTVSLAHPCYPTPPISFV